MRAFIIVVGVLLGICGAIDGRTPVFSTYVTTKNVTGTDYETSTTHRGSYIDVHVVAQPHNLFIGRCLRGQKQLHGENIILNNDGKSHVTAVIRINVDGPVDITCVKVLDQTPGAGAYPSYIGGGVGHQFVEIGVSTQYGKGFQFYVQILGNYRKIK